MNSKRLLYPLLVLLIFLLGSPLATWAFPALGGALAPRGERILSYDSAITVHPDSSMTVTETIQVRAEGTEIKRGIYRDFPTRYRDQKGLKYRVGFKVLEVLRDGQPEPHFIKNISNGKRLYIGQESYFLDPGIYTYTITYRTDRQLGYFDEHDELYWNAIGTGWVFPIDRASATVTLPPGTKPLWAEAYTGEPGATGRDYRQSLNPVTGQVSWTVTRGLDSYEGLTIVVGWPKGHVTAPTMLQRLWYIFRDNFTLILALLGLFGLAIYYLYAWALVGKDPAPGSIFPLYNPPQDFSPAAVRFLRKMGYDNQVFAAAVINMAVKGVLTIREESKLLSKTFTLIKKSTDKSVLTPEEAKIFEALLGVSQEFTFDDADYAKVQGAIEALKNSLEAHYQNTYFVTNSKYSTAGILISLATVVPGVIESMSNSTFSWPLLLIGIALIILNSMFRLLMKAPTLSGRKILDQIEGFKMFLSISEKDRLNLVYPMEKTPELFEKYLPYALALGVEQAWSEQFAAVLARAGQNGQPYSPVWYPGHSWGDFSSSHFAASLGDAITSSASPPGSSSGGGGGGSSGGGGGGGGGGGW